jgi:hypothetical protein
MISRLALACIGIVTTSALWPVGTARADDLRLTRGYGSRAVEPCDPFAEEVDSPAPTGSCPRFGGRVRVDLGGQASPRPGTGYGPAAVRVDEGAEGSAGRLYAPSQLDSGMTRSHLRVPGPDAAGPFDSTSAR